MVPDPLLADYSEVLSDIILNFTLEIGYIVMIIGRKPEKRNYCADCRFRRYCEGNGMHLCDSDGNLMHCHLLKFEDSK